MNLPLKTILILSLLFCFGCKSRYPQTTQVSEAFQVTRLSKNTWQHISYLETETWGKVACNGLIFAKNGEAIVFDTPTTKEAAEELINFVKNNLKASIKAVVINHFHNDCLAQLPLFHETSIPSYAHKKTIKLAADNQFTVPKFGFDSVMNMQIGGEAVVNYYLGEAHTVDNIVSYIPSEKTLFGGCMVKAMNAGKGHLADANITAWPETIKKVQNTFPNVKIVVPGHGPAGGPELLGFTVKLFEEKPF